MKHHLKQFFIPHAENNYKPHILHTKRFVFYSLFFVLIKVGLITFSVLIPEQAYLHPDILESQYQEIVNMTNEVRAKEGLSPLRVVRTLDRSAQLKADDMAVKGYFSHTSPEKKSLADFLKQAGYTYSVAGENLAVGFADGAAVVRGWVNSKTHYANLIDPEFKDLGVGLESGWYQGEQTVFVAQHFGTPSIRATQSAEAGPEEEGAIQLAVENRGVVRGAQLTSVNATSTTEPHSSFVVDQAQSRVYWLEVGEVTELRVRAVVTGTVSLAYVNIGDLTIPLSEEKNGVWAGVSTVTSKADQFFNPIITPSLTLVGQDGGKFIEPVRWFNIKTPARTLGVTYFQAEHLLSSVTEIFAMSRVVYAAFILLFVVALFINIVVEIRRQHHHIIAQTIVMISLLVGLWWL